MDVFYFGLWFERFMSSLNIADADFQKKLIEDCCKWSPSDRPSFRKIVARLKSDEFGKNGMVDKMISRLEAHTQQLETIVAER